MCNILLEGLLYTIYISCYITYVTDHIIQLEFMTE